MSSTIRTTLLALIIGGAMGLIAFQLAAQGKLPLKISAQTATKTQVAQTQTVVQEENAIIDVADKNSPSVVAIGVSTQRATFNSLDPFSSQRADPNNPNNTIGTGFVVNADKGILVTNRHVVSDTSLKYTVISKDGKKYNISKIYRDPNVDVALVQIDANDLKALNLGDSSQLRVGQTTIAIGNALGQFTNTVTTGIVSGIGRAVTAGDPFAGESEQLDNLIQTSAAINPGNSGGPLLNSSGQVIGVNVATTEGAQNIGFAIPINAVKKMVDEFNTTGTISRPFIGVQYSFVSRDVAIMNQVPSGVYVQDVVQGSPAEKANIQQGDIITKIDGQTIDSQSKLSDIVQAKKVGDKVNLTIWNNGQERTVTVTLENNTGQ